MANVGFKRSTQAKIDALQSYEDGHFYLTTDTDRLYVAQSNNELVELNKSIKTVSSISSLPTTTAATTTEIKGSEVAVGQFYYIMPDNSGNGYDSNINKGNILAVCTSIVDGAITWKQVNPDTDHNDDTRVSSISASKSASSTTSALIYNLSVGQVTKHLNPSGASDTNLSAVTGTLTISAEDIASIAVDVAVGVTSTTPSATAVTIQTAGVGSATAQSLAISTTGSVSLSGTPGNLLITGQDTKYTLAKPGVASATAANTASVNLTGTGESAGASGSISLKTGDGLAINNVTANQVLFYHKASGVTSGTYGTNSNTTPSAGGSIVIPKVTVDVMGHVTSTTNQTITLPGDTYVTAVSASNNGKITISQNNGVSDISSTAVLFYQINKYNSSGTATTETINNQNNLGNFYTKEAIDGLLQGLDALTYKGTLGTGGTTATLPAHPGNGDTYKVAVAGTYGGHQCAVGDLLIASGTEGDNGTISSPEWTWISNGDDTDTTYTFSVNDNTIQTTPKGSSTTAIAIIAGGDKISASTNGKTITLSHDTASVVAGTYGLASSTAPTAGSDVSIPKITVDAYGHVTSATSNLLTLPADSVASLGVNAGTAALVFKSSTGASAKNIELVGGTAITAVAENDKITFNHDAKTVSVTANGGTNGTSLSFGGTFTVVTSTTADAQGHVSNITTEKFKLPTQTTYTLSAGSVTANTAGRITLTPAGGSAQNITISSESLKVVTTSNTMAIDLVWDEW